MAYFKVYASICQGQISSAGELVVNSQYLSCMQENTNFNWDKKELQQIIIVLTHTILNQCIDVVSVKFVHDIPRSVCNRNE